MNSTTAYGLLAIFICLGLGVYSFLRNQPILVALFVIIAAVLFMLINFDDERGVWDFFI